MPYQVLNDKGQPVVLNAQEQALANIIQAQNQPILNALGYEIPITTLTQILKSVTEQKFFQVPVADYMPLVVGEGAWSATITKYRDYSVGGDFGTGILNTGNDQARLAQVGSAIDAVNTPVINWAKGIGWSLMDLNIAARSGNWDVVSSKERTRKKNWDLGIQKLAFVGLTDNTNVKGLITLPGITSNTAIITKFIYSMTASEFTTFLGTFLQAYRANVVQTAWPTHFIMPEADYNGCANSADETFPLKSRLDRILEVCKTITQNQNFKVLPLAYANKTVNVNYPGLNLNRYTLFNYDMDSFRMDIPVDYTSTLANTINGFNFENVGYGQFTGVQVYRPLEMLYFDF